VNIRTPESSLWQYRLEPRSVLSHLNLDSYPNNNIWFAKWAGESSLGRLDLIWSWCSFLLMVTLVQHNMHKLVVSHLTVDPSDFSFTLPRVHSFGSVNVFSSVSRQE